MKIVESKVEYLPQGEGLDEMYKHIERCGRVCYKSEDKITEGSAKGFVDRMIKSNHTAVLEHGTLYFVERYREPNHPSILQGNPYTKTVPLEIEGQTWYNTTTNMRVIVELLSNWRDWMNTPNVSWEPLEEHEKRYTFKFICSRGIANELVRHRCFSFAQESSRYCNYSKDKFNNEITFVRPYWTKLNPGPYVITPDMKKDTCNIEGDGYYKELTDTKEEELLLNYINSERTYLDLLDKGAQPQDAREVLPLGLKTELCMTGFASDWREFLDKRLFEKTGKVHPDMKVLMKKLQKVAEDAGIWKDIMSHHSKY